MTQRSAFARRPLAAALFVALIAPGMAFAQTAKEKALEARVADLERQVQLLLSTTQQQQTQISQAQTDVTAVKTVQAQQPLAAQVPAGKQPIQVTTITPGAAPGTTVKIGGFIKADFLATQTSDGQLADDATGRSLYLPGQTPVEGAGGSGKDDALVGMAPERGIVELVTTIMHQADPARRVVVLQLLKVKQGAW